MAQAQAAEEATREPAAASFKTAASRYLVSATSDDPKLAHIAPDDKQKVRMVVGQLPADRAPFLGFVEGGLYQFSTDAHCIAPQS